MFPWLSSEDHSSGDFAMEPAGPTSYYPVTRGEHLGPYGAPRESAAFHGLCDGPGRDRTCDLGIKSPTRLKRANRNESNRTSMESRLAVSFAQVVGLVRN
jgi:hypothetical protein